MLPLLARCSRMLRRQHIGGGRDRQEEVRTGAGGLLRVPTPQERGQLRPTSTVEERTRC